MTPSPGIDAGRCPARSRRVAYVPGTAFFADGFGAGSMRLSFCYPTPSGSARAPPPGRRPRGGDGAARDVRRHPCPPCAPQRVRRPRNGSHDRSSHRRAGRRPVPRARRLAAVGRCTAEALRSAGLDVAERRRRTPVSPPSRRPPTCVVPMLHGESGEDGAIREVLDLLGVPYVGSGPAACRTAFDKPVAKSVVARVGITTPRACAPHETFREPGAAQVMDAVIARLGLLIVVAQRSGSPRLHARRVRRRPAGRDGQRLRLRLRGPDRDVRRRDGGLGARGGRRLRPASPPAVATSSLTGRSTTTPLATPPAPRSSRSRPDCPRRAGRVRAVAVAAHEALGLRDLSRPT